MMIEVVAPHGAPGKDKGDLFESFASEFLKTQGFVVVSQVRSTAVELDLLCRHQVNGRQVYVECKAHREPLSATVLRSLLGTVTFKKIQEGWLVSAGPLGKDSKGFVEDWESRPTEERQKMSFYTPARMIESFLGARLIKAVPSRVVEDVRDPAIRIGDWVLLISPFGRFWAAPTLESGVPRGVVVYDSDRGRLVRDNQLLKRLGSTDSSLHSLDFERFGRSAGVAHPTSGSLDRIVEVAHGDSWKDYRPARPEDFVGRASQQRQILDLLSSVRSGKTTTRVFAVTGDSGMGKSSLVAKIRERSRNKRYRGRFFAYALDARAARTGGYVLSALLIALRAAATAGFGTADPEPLVISDYADPLSSGSIQEFLRALASRRQVVCVIFDQFEELYSKPELFEVFEEAQRLFLSAAAASSNLVLGFAWRSDSTVPQDHPAYYMWHRLADHRIEIQLGPFSAAESAHALTIFQKELGKRLHPELRRQILENSRGFPWLLKKLCIHIFEQVGAGVREGALRETLDASALFDRDLSQLTQPQQACLRAIARTAPADWFEILDTYGADVLRALQDKRLVVRSGDRINVYWDIFKDYLLTRKIPYIPFTYIPSSPSIDALLRIAALLSRDTGHSIEDLSQHVELSEKTAANIVRDLVMLGIATGDIASPRLDPSMQSGEGKPVLQKIREVFRRHAVALALVRREHGSRLFLADIATALNQVNPGAKHSPRTWKLYAERLASWLCAAGFLVPDPAGGWRREDVGQAVSPTHSQRGRATGPFIGAAPPEAVLRAIALVHRRPMTTAHVQQARLRNAVGVLLRFGLLSRDADDSLHRASWSTPEEAIMLLRRAIVATDAILIALGFLRRGRRSGAEVGEHVARTLDQHWAQASTMRIGNALRRWADWAVASSGARSSTQSLRRS
jgi:Holliday junction resolvase-like predicted endonuclease